MGDLAMDITLKDEVVIPVPEPLTSFSASAFSATVIDLGWIDNGLLAKDYELEYGTDGTFAVKTTVILPSSPGSGGIYTVTGLTAATLYYFRIRAKNPTGASAWVTTTESTL